MSRGPGTSGWGASSSWRRASLFALLLSFAWMIAPRSVEAAAPSKDALKRVMTSIREDESFKVRLQAIRVLVKQLKGSKTPADDEVFAVLADAATKDEEHLVRGLACFAIGELADERGKPGLERAKADPHPFVRAQAEEALKVIAAKASPPTDDTKAGGEGAAKLVAVGAVAGSRRTLVIAVDATPGVGTDLDGALLQALRSELERQKKDGYTIAESAGSALGFKLSGSVAERKTEAVGDGSSKVSIGVRITISTVPENHLRGMTNAKASAAVTVSGAALAKAETTVLRAAVGRAVKDSLSQLAE